MFNNNNNHLYNRDRIGVAAKRSPRRGTHPLILRGSFFFDYRLLPIPYPRHPALLREDTTHAWSADDRGYQREEPIHEHGEHIAV